MRGVPLPFRSWTGGVPIDLWAWLSWGVLLVNVVGVVVRGRVDGKRFLDDAWAWFRPEAREEA